MVRFLRPEVRYRLLRRRLFVLIYRKAYACEPRISFEPQASGVISTTAIAGIQKDLVGQNTYAGIPESVIRILLVSVLLVQSYL